MVIKKNGRRERFDRKKVVEGLVRACEKRPLSMVSIQGIVSEAEFLVLESKDQECTTTRIGEFLLQKLHSLDKVAYIRFASVYRDFQNEQQFINELTKLKQKK